MMSASVRWCSGYSLNEWLVKGRLYALGPYRWRHFDAVTRCYLDIAGCWHFARKLYDRTAFLGHSGLDSDHLRRGCLLLRDTPQTIESSLLIDYGMGMFTAPMPNKFVGAI
jgi:hypothetical protein